MAAVPATAQLQNAELITISSFVIATLGGWQKTAQEARTKMITVLNAWSAMGMTIALTMRSVTLETTPVRGSPAHPLVATTAIAKPSATMRVNANAMTAITMTQPLSLLAFKVNTALMDH